MSYNRIAGQGVERLEALSDGIFAVAMTLLVLDLRLPAVIRESRFQISKIQAPFPESRILNPGFSSPDFSS
jgi:uncharacterized membrane protein